MSHKESHGLKGLAAALVIDLIGASSFLFPAMGEFADVIWAPISAYLIFKLFKSKTGATIGFIEELLPFADFIPTATIIWITTHFNLGPKKKVVDGLDPDLEVKSPL